MPSMTNGMCGIDDVQLAEGSDIQPFQGWGQAMTPTQGGASLTLGFKIKPPWGLGTDPAGLCVRLVIIIRLSLSVSPLPLLRPLAAYRH